MPASIRVDAHEVQEALDEIAWLISPPSIAAVLGTEVGDFLRFEAEARFDDQGTEDAPWAPLKPATQSIRESMGLDPTWPINVRTADMRDFLIGNRGVVEVAALGVDLTWPGPADAQIEEELTTAQLGSNDPYTVPRPVVDLTPGDAVAILEILDLWLKEGFRTHGVGRATTFTGMEP